MTWLKHLVIYSVLNNFNQVISRHLFTNLLTKGECCFDCLLFHKCVWFCQVSKLEHIYIHSIDGIVRYVTKPTKWLCAQRRLRSAWASTQSDQIPRCALSAYLRSQDFFMRTAKTLIRLGGCPGWSESTLGAHVSVLVCHEAAQSSWGGSVIILATKRMFLMRQARDMRI